MATLGIDLSRLSTADLLRLRDAAEARDQPELAAEVAAVLEHRRRTPSQALAAWIDSSPPPSWGHGQARDDGLEATSGRWLGVTAAALGAALLAGGTAWWLTRPPPPAPAPHLEAALAAPAAPPTVAAADPLAAPPSAERPELPGPAAAAPAEPRTRAKTRKRARQPAVSETVATAGSAPAETSADTSPPCAIGDGAADRLVCAAPSLSAAHQAMLDAYDHALAAGADKDAIDRTQAKWREVRDGARDPDTLSGLYHRRIGELEAAAAKARRQR